jgi:hypothetical protein
MAKKIVVEYEGFEFSELDESAKDRVRSWFAEGMLDYKWWDFVYDDFVAEMAEFGIDIAAKDIEFSGFYHQGSGACFSTSMNERDIIQYLKTTKQTKKYWRLYLNLIRDNIYMGVLIKGSSRWGFGQSSDLDFTVYSDALMNNDDLYNVIYGMAGELEEDILDFCRDKASDLYRSLEREYEFQTSDEVIADSCEANEWYFTERGSLI